ncbi:hypothetical protein OKW30_006568 [Paraburkholderia sp. Clong3]
MTVFSLLDPTTDESADLVGDVSEIDGYSSVQTRALIGVPSDSSGAAFDPVFSDASAAQTSGPSSGLRRIATAIELPTINSDNVARLWIDGVKVIDKTSTTPGSATGKVHLAANQSASIKVEYVHGTGAASMHLLWSNPAAKSPGVLKIVPSDSLVTSS